MALVVVCAVVVIAAAGTAMYLGRRAHAVGPATSPATTQGGDVFSEIERLAKEGKGDEAIALCQRMIKQNANDAKAHYQLGVIYYHMNRINDATAELVEAHRLAPAPGSGASPELAKQISKDLGQMYLSQGKIMEASDHYGKEALAHPDDADAQNDYGVIQTKLNRHAEAAESFAKAIKVNPNHVDAHYNLGLTQFERWRLDDAIREYREALRLKPDYIDATFNLARALARRGQYSDAIAELDKVLAVRNQTADAYYEKGICQLRLGQETAAVSSFTEALRHYPDHADAHMQLGLILSRLNKPQQACPHFIKVTQLRPSDADAYYQVAFCQLRMGKVEEAIAGYRDALRLRPDWPEAQNDLAWILATTSDDKLRNPNEAGMLAKGGFEAARRKPPLFLDTLAAAQAGVGDFANAQKTEQVAIDAARALGDEKLAARMEKHMAAYKENKPYREDAPKGE
jgi:tetratricopeptide (TPR) repeat protein